MNKEVAKALADDMLQSVLSRGRSEIRALLKEPEHEFVGKGGVEYQLRISAFCDDPKKKIIRVKVDVDDQKFWPTFIPLSRSDFFTRNEGVFLLVKGWERIEELTPTAGCRDRTDPDCRGRRR